MAKKAPGTAHRKGISLVEIMRRFPNDATAEAYFVEHRWPNGVACPHCGSTNVQSGTAHKTMPYRCREKECAKRFSAKTGTVMEGSKLGFQVWMIATFLLSTNLKSVSSMKLHRDLEITQKSAWFLAHRLRQALDRDGDMFAGPVEVDETYIGGKRKNLAGTGCGAVGKVAAVGIKDRATKQIRAKVVEATDKPTSKASSSRTQLPSRPSIPTGRPPTKDSHSNTRASSTAFRSAFEAWRTRTAPSPSGRC